MNARTPSIALLCSLACSGAAPSAATGSSGAVDATAAPTSATTVASSETGDDDSGGSGDSDDGAALERYCDEPVAEVEARIDAWLAQLEVDEKVAMMHGHGLLPVDGTWRVDGHDVLAIPGLRMLDGPRGVSQVSGEDAVAFPVGIARGATWDPALEAEVGAAIARETRSVGADVLLAPTINLLRHPRWGRAQETYGEDTFHVGAMALGFIDGAQSEHVIATAKHFAANSIEDTRFDVDVTLDERTLHEVFLPHFRRAVVEANVGAVMSAYNSVNGQHCDVNPTLLRDILRDEWHFAGLVMSDWIQGTHGDVEALRAGLDVEMPSGAHFGRLTQAIAGGELDEAELDASLRRVLRAQLCERLDSDPAVLDPGARNTAAHLALAEEVARRSIVLARNEGVLPLDRTSIGELVVMGPLADVENLGDRGSSAVQVGEVVTALEGIVDRAGTVGVTHLGATTLGPDELAAIAAADAVVLVIGLDADSEGEGLLAAGDRDSLALPPEHLQLVHEVAALGRPTIVVLEGGGPILVSDFIDEVDALLFAWYPGVRGGFAIADLLFGDAEPSGRLPAVVPDAEGDLPPFDNVSLAVDYGYLHGYRWLDAMATPAALPFGFGLSYTQVSYDAIRVAHEVVGRDDVIVVEVDVSNTGTRAAIETVQLYASMPDTAWLRAPKDLRGFAQIELAAGGSGTATLELPVASLAIRDPDAHAWIVEPGAVQLRAGPSSASLPLVAEVTIMP